MTPDQYWDGDPALTKDYRKADELTRKRKNQELWLQGMYIYNAVCCAAPLMQAFAKKGTKAYPYPDEPYPMTAKEIADKKARDERRAIAENIEKMKRFAQNFNDQFEKQKER